MAEQTWTLLNVEDRTWREDFSLSDKDVEGSAQGYSLEKRTLRGGLSDGVETLRVDNGRFAFTVLPTRGMNIWKAWLGSGAEGELGWKSPVRGPVHPGFVPLAEPSGLGWLDGFDELLARCGLESNGAPEFDETGKLSYPLHGRIGNRPAHFVEVGVDGQRGEIRVTGVVEETRFHFAKLQLTSTISTRVGEAGFRLRDTVKNLSDSPAGMQLLYHVNFGAPLLDAGSRFLAPVKAVVPRNPHAASGVATWDNYQAPTPGFEEQVYFLDLLGDEQGQTQTLLKNAHGTRGVALYFNKKHLPCYTVWKNTTSLRDGYVTGLEPGTNFPNPRSYEARQQRVVNLPPGGEYTFDLRLEALDSADNIRQAEAAIQKLQEQSIPKIFDAPQKGWCA